MTPDDVAARVYARGFVLSQETTGDLRARLADCPYGENLGRWTQTFFGPCALWVDPLLHYARAAEGRFGVGVMGLCINPFDGLCDNGNIAAALLAALQGGKTGFLDYLDQLTGAFVILYRENADVFVLQDTAATKPVYYHRTPQGRLTASSHARIVQHAYGLPPDPRAEAVYASTIYRKDPSRYLPGMITPYDGLLPLTANHELAVSSGRSQRFFPREPLAPRPFDDSIVDEIAGIMVAQARIIAGLGRPLRLAATGGRDSRVSAVAFSGQPGLEYYSFHMPTINHLTDDVDIARRLAEIEGVDLKVYELEKYRLPGFQEAFRAHSPRGIWPAAAMCYLAEFDPRAIHIRSTVSEIGRLFYTNRKATTVTPDLLANVYTRTEFSADPMVTDTMRDFIDLTGFDTQVFHGYDLHDMFYWEHRNSKWQNILCAEGEMATDIFIPFNNRALLKKFMAVPYENRLHADIHIALCHRLKPEFRSVGFA